MIKKANAGDTIIQLEYKDYIDDNDVGFTCEYIEHVVTENYKWRAACIQFINIARTNYSIGLVNPFSCFPTLKAAQRAYKSILRQELQVAQLKVKVVSERLAELNSKVSKP